MVLKQIKLSEFDTVYAHIENNFILAERRDYENAVTLLENSCFTVYHVEHDNQNVGFVILWELDEFDFIEYLVIYERYRNQGFGAKTLELLKSRGKKLVLEAELPISDIQKRRVAFYQRCAFVKNSFDYVQPPYRQGEHGVPMVIMSYPDALEDKESTVCKLYRRVYNVNYEKNTYIS